MQKVVFSVSKVNRDEKLKGIGYLSEGNLLIPAISKKGKPYIRVFEDITKSCHSSLHSPPRLHGRLRGLFLNSSALWKRDLTAPAMQIF